MTASDPRAADESPLERAYLDYIELWDAGTAPDVKAYCAARPELRDALAEKIHEFTEMARGLALAGVNAAEPPASGRTLGDFVLLREIGRGGMGVVYEAEQRSLRRRVALKVLGPHPSLVPEAIDRFRREASTAARLRHPGIVEIFGVGESDGVHFFAMELVEGAPLDEVLASWKGRAPETLDGRALVEAVGAIARRRVADPNDVSRASARAPTVRWSRSFVEAIGDVARQVAEALDHAHAAGVVHRDVKPSNILLREDGRAVLTDFGLARDADLPSLTRTGEFAGTPYYASPEQLSAGRQSVGAASDVYSLGVTLFEALTMRRPFVGATTEEVAAKILVDEAPNPRKFNPALPTDLATILAKALEKDPARRYLTAGALAEDLRAFLAFRPIAARPATAATRVVKFARRNPGTSAGLGAAATFAVAASVWWWLQPGYVTFTSPTAGAVVFVDGVKHGQTPLENLRLAPGSHKIHFESGAELFTPDEEILVARGRVKSVDRALTSRNGVLELHSTPPGARVKLRGDGGREMDIPDPTPTRFDVPAGRYEARFTLAGFPESVKPVEVPSGGVRVSLGTEWPIGGLVLSANRPGARVEIFAADDPKKTAPLREVNLPSSEPLWLPAGAYALRAHLINHLSPERRGVNIRPGAETAVHLSLVSADKVFSGAMRGEIRVVTTADVDGDGLADVVAGTSEGQVSALRLDGGRIDFELGEAVTALASAGTSADGMSRIVALAKDGRVLTMAGDGAPQQIAVVPRHCQHLAVTDLDGDGTLELVVGGGADAGEELRAMGLDGSPRFSVLTKDQVRALQIADLDGDGTPEIIVGTHYGKLRVLESGGELRREWQNTGKAISIAVGRKEGSGGAVLFVGFDSNKLLGFDPQADIRFTRDADDYVAFALALDLAGHGEDGVVVATTSGQLCAFGAHGEPVFEASGGSMTVGLTPIDLDADGRPEIAAAAAAGRVVLLGRDGTPRGTLDTRSQARQIATADLDGDGEGDLVLGTGSSQIEVHTFDRRLRLVRNFAASVSDVAVLRGAPGPGLVARSRNGDFEIVRNDGVSVRSFPTTTPWKFALAEPGDGAPFEIVAPGLDPVIVALDATGKERWRTRKLGGVGNLDTVSVPGEPGYWVVAGMQNGRALVLDSQGSLLADVKAQGRVLLAGALRDSTGAWEFHANAYQDALFGFDVKGSVKFRIPLSGTVLADYGESSRGETGWALGVDDDRILWLPRSPAGPMRRIGRLGHTISSLVVRDLDGDGVSEILAGSASGEIAVFNAAGERVFTRNLGYNAYRVIASDLDGDGRLEIVGALGERNELVAWSVPENDPRVVARRRFLEGLDAAERRDERAAALAFEEARFRWLPLDDSDLEAIRARLEAIPRSEAASRMLWILDRIRPPLATQRIEAIQDLVDLGHPVLAARLARECLRTQVASSGYAAKINDMAWYWVDPRAPRPEAREVALLVAEAAVKASERKDAVILDTLAEALFVNGKLSEALAVNAEALAKCPADDPKNRAALEAARARMGAALASPASAPGR